MAGCLDCLGDAEISQKGAGPLRIQQFKVTCILDWATPGTRDNLGISLKNSSARLGLGYTI